MDSVRLKISIKDWFYITIIAALFGFLFSLFFVFFDTSFKNLSTLIFSISTSILISFFAFFLITFLNEFILPKLSKKFWYLISFIFSFLSGFLGFSLSFYLFSQSGFKVVEYISDFWVYISIITGFLTFLIGLILYWFISMKYKNELTNTQILQSKIKALENELNPHFLFNALNSLSELIYLDPKKAEMMTLDLSKFLRNAINKESLVSINTEIEMVQNYLEIENIRFDNNIVLNVYSSLKKNNIKIPKFSIQLLVENAIKHGYKGEKLEIEINIDNYKIEVLNNGTIPQKIVYGTGLKNLKQRLELLNIGKLDYKVYKDKMCFIIHLKGKK